jgi:hypothetical protein
MDRRAGCGPDAYRARHTGTVNCAYSIEMLKFIVNFLLRHHISINILSGCFVKHRSTGSRFMIRSKAKRLFYSLPLFATLLVSGIAVVQDAVTCDPTILANHSIAVDGTGKIVSWMQPRDRAFAEAAAAGWHFILDLAPIEPNGKKGYFSSCAHEAQEIPGHATGASLDMAGLFGEFVESAIPYYAFTSNHSCIDAVVEMMDHALRFGLTPSNWSWPNMPYAWSPGGQLFYSGRIEPDKAAEFGTGLLQLWAVTGNTSYVLASRVRAGDENRSPWPFRVDPRRGQVTGEYCGHVVGILKFLDLLVAYGLGNVSACERARDIGRSYLISHIIPQNDWRNYFEDYSDNEDTKSELVPDETIIYLLSATARYWAIGELGANGFDAVIRGIWQWVEIVLGKDRWLDYGVLPVSEQTALYFGEFCHTARHGASKAAYASLFDDDDIKNQAFRLLSWATYAVQPESGFIYFSSNPLNNYRIWYTDGYADYIRHYMSAIGDLPEWAPAGEPHLVHSTAVVNNISYGAGNVTYSVFPGSIVDGESVETLRLPVLPSDVTLGGTPVPHFTSFSIAPTGNAYVVEQVDGSGDMIVRVRHNGAAPISILY